MKNIILLLPVLITAIACREQIQPEKEKVIGPLLLKYPATDTFVVPMGIDTYAAYLITEKKDTFHIEFGNSRVIFDLYFEPPRAIELKYKDILTIQLGHVPSPESTAFSLSPEIDNRQNIFDKNYYLYDTINGIPAKIVQPKRIGDGLTGIYFPELRNGNGFSMYAMNLDSAAHLQALLLFRKINYKN